MRVAGLWGCHTQQGFTENPDGCRSGSKSGVHVSMRSQESHRQTAVVSWDGAMELRLESALTFCKLLQHRTDTGVYDRGFRCLMPRKWSAAPQKEWVGKLRPQRR